MENVKCEMWHVKQLKPDVKSVGSRQGLHEWEGERGGRKREGTGGGANPHPNGHLNK